MKQFTAWLTGNEHNELTLWPGGVELRYRDRMWDTSPGTWPNHEYPLEMLEEGLSPEDFRLYKIVSGGNLQVPSGTPFIIQVTARKIDLGMSGAQLMSLWSNANKKMEQMKRDLRGGNAEAMKEHRDKAIEALQKMNLGEEV